MLIEHEYERKGALTYLAVWDVHRAKLFGQYEPKTGIASLNKLITCVMSQVPYCNAKRIFLLWTMDPRIADRPVSKGCKRLGNPRAPASADPGQLAQSKWPINCREHPVYPTTSKC
jgi:hypothetical protein